MHPEVIDAIVTEAGATFIRVFGCNAIQQRNYRNIQSFQTAHLPLRLAGALMIARIKDLLIMMMMMRLLFISYKNIMYAVVFIMYRFPFYVEA